MKKAISIIREKKEGESRVILGPRQVAMFRKAGFQVFVEKNAGGKVRFSNEEYINNGATIVDTATSRFLTAKTSIAMVSVTRKCNLQNICPHCSQELFRY